MSSTKQTHTNDNKADAKQQSPKCETGIDILTQQQIHPATLIQRARLNPEALTPRDILQLQRTIGNRAVGQLLAQPTQHQLIQNVSPGNSNIVQREENKLGFEIEFRKNPVFMPQNPNKSWDRAIGFLQGNISPKLIQQPVVDNLVMQPDAARGAGTKQVLATIPKKWQSNDYQKLMDMIATPRVAEVKTNPGKGEYNNKDKEKVLFDLRWLEENWYKPFKVPLKKAGGSSLVGDKMMIGIPTDDVAYWTIRKAMTGEEGERGDVVNAFIDALINSWSEYNDPAMHLQVTLGVDLAGVGELFEKRSESLARSEQEDMKRAADILRCAKVLANHMMTKYQHLRLNTDRSIHGAWALLFQDLLRMTIGKKQIGSSVKNTFAFMPRSTEVILATIRQSLIGDKVDLLLFNKLVSFLFDYAENLLSKEWVNLAETIPDSETSDFLDSLGKQIGKSKAKNKETLRIETLLDATEAVKEAVLNNTNTLPWSTTGGREFKNPRPKAILLEDRYINKEVSDWVSLVKLVVDALGNVRNE